MTTATMLERSLSAWLRGEAPTRRRRVLLGLDEIDHTQQRRSWWPARRFPAMNTFAKALVATAAVVAVAVVGINLLPGSQTGAGGPPPPASPSAVPPVPFAESDPGTDRVARDARAHAVRAGRLRRRGPARRFDARSPSRPCLARERTRRAWRARSSSQRSARWGDPGLCRWGGLFSEPCRTEAETAQAPTSPSARRSTTW